MIKSESKTSQALSFIGFGKVALSLTGHCSRRMAPTVTGALTPVLRKEGPIAYHRCGRTGPYCIVIVELALPLT